MYKYRVVTHVDGYRVEYSYNGGSWQVYSIVYLTKFFAKWRIKREVESDKFIAKRTAREASFIQKVVYGPYP